MKFVDLSLKPWLQTSLKANGFINLTPIQQKSLTTVSDHHNSLLLAQTGSGKTLCYLLPILNKIVPLTPKRIQAIVVVPTKELSWQIYDNFVKLAKPNIEIKVGIYKNDNFDESCDILITNLPKLKTSIVKGRLNSKFLKTIVFDEADMLFDHSFIGDIKYIFEKMQLHRTNIQKIFLSASINQSQTAIYKKVAHDLKVILDNDKLYRHQQINHIVVYTKNNLEPFSVLQQLINVINPYMCIIFANTKQEVKKIYLWLRSVKKFVAILHNDLDDRTRKNIFKQLKNNHYKYLVATDLASRGIDLEGVSDIISYNLPNDDLWYLHRSGRTGRKNYHGNSYVIYNKTIDKQIARLSSKSISWRYYLLVNNQLINKDKNTHFKKNWLNNDPIWKMQINRLYNNKAKRVKPGYKKKLKQQIFKLKQKAKRKYLDNKYKNILIQRSKYGNKIK